MNGRMNVSKKKVVEDFLSKHNPYRHNESLQFDLRAYASYVREHNIDVSLIDDTVFSMFEERGEKTN